jgi:hypothetical protein
MNSLGYIIVDTVPNIICTKDRLQLVATGYLPVLENSQICGNRNRNRSKTGPNKIDGPVAIGSVWSGPRSFSGCTTGPSNTKHTSFRSSSFALSAVRGWGVYWVIGIDSCSGRFLLQYSSEESTAKSTVPFVSSCRCKRSRRRRFASRLQK